MDYILARHYRQGLCDYVARIDPVALTIDPQSAIGWPTLWDARRWLDCQPSPVRHRLADFRPVPRTEP